MPGSQKNRSQGVVYLQASVKYKEYLPKAVDYFVEKKEAFSQKYNPEGLTKKVKAVAAKAGCTTIYYALLLFYALADEKMPLSKKVTVIAALGYFIAPVDFIPDFIVGGLIDDGSVLLYAIHQIQAYIDESVKEKSKAKLQEWFGPQEIYELPKV